MKTTSKLLLIHNLIGSKLLDFKPLQSSYVNQTWVFTYKGKSNNHKRIFNRISKLINKNDVWEKVNLYRFGLKQNDEGIFNLTFEFNK